MQLQLVRATREARQFDEIVSAFTPPMRRVCPHLTDAELRQMIERMAMHQLLEEQRRCAAPRRPSQSRHVSSGRRTTTLHSC